PGLVQLFCWELLKRLHTQARTSLPPYFVRQSDVEAVYRKVHDSIRERFNWTLALDMRYQAIAWAMIGEQTGADSYTEALSPDTILQMASKWWPQGLGEIDTEQLRGLLDEMCGLGVLVRDGDGHYRLRSPNLIRLMGTEDDIIARLIELSGKSLGVKF